MNMTAEHIEVMKMLLGEDPEKIVELYGPPVKKISKELVKFIFEIVADGVKSASDLHIPEIAAKLQGQTMQAYLAEGFSRKEAMALMLKGSPLMEQAFRRLQNKQE